MKIAYLASGAVPSSAANSVHVAHMCDSLAACGVTVSLMTPTSSIKRVATNDEVKSLYGVNGGFMLRPIFSPRVRGGRVFYEMHLARLLKEMNPDIVYSRHLAGARKAVSLSLPTVYEAHKSDWSRSRTGQERFEKVINSPSFRMLVVISQALAREAIAAYPMLEGRVFVAADGAPSWKAPPEKPIGPKMILGYFGSLYPGKGVETILELAAQCPWAEFRVTGGEPDEIKYWMQKARSENVLFFGRRPHAELWPAMAECDGFLAPYRRRVEVHGGGGDVASWMSPLKIFEYMAMNRPILASDLPVLQEVLEHGRNALLLDPDDVSAWRDAITQVRDDPALRQRLAHTARADFEANYTWKARADRILSEIRRLRAVI